MPVRVVVDDGHGEPAVSVGAMRFEADEEEKRRDREEGKRLLYVALTRARDRLYVASALGRDGTLAPAPGSLADVLPRPLLDELSAPTTSDADVWEWSGAAGAHRFRRCRPLAVPVPLVAGAPAPRGDVARVDLFAPVPAGDPMPALTVREHVHDEAPARADRDPIEAGGALTGRIVHRLFQVLDGVSPAEVDDDAVRDAARRAVLEEERESVVDLEAIAREAAATWRALRGRPDVEAVFAGADALYEVPFSLRHGATIVRGAIDCVVLRPGGDVVVVEIKTGRPAAWHERQLDAYVRAARALVPGATVRGMLLAPVSAVDAENG